MPKWFMWPLVEMEGRFLFGERFIIIPSTMVLNKGWRHPPIDSTLMLV